ncbi:MAG: TIGR04283 family arsenosugar biosynthesis glycosyltransferase [Pyrinomonadaceae bacterium]
MSVDVSIIIPTLNEATEIGRTLDELRTLAGSFEIIVADGGSTDETCELAKSREATVISMEPGRGIQLHAGALAATGSVLWFLHADSIPPTDAILLIHEALSGGNVVGGNFALRFDGDSRAAAFMNQFYDKIRHIGLLYGDSGIFVRRDVYQQIGGFKPLPLFEDLEFVRRLKGSGKLVRVKSEITTSSRRFDGRPFLPVFFRWVLFQCLYWLGVSPSFLARSYQPVRRQTDSEN